MRRLVIRGLVAAMAAALLVGTPVSSEAATYSKSPPSGLKVSLKANTYMQLSWKAVSGAKGYTIQYSTSSSMSNPQYRKPEGMTETQINGLKENTKYWFRIRARDSSKDITDWSGKISAWTDKQAFSAPSRPSVSYLRKDGFKLSWSEVPNASRYRVQMSTRSSFTGTGEAGGSGGAPIYLYTRNTEASTWLGNQAVDNATTVVNGQEVPAPADLIKPDTKYYVRAKALEAKQDEDGNVYDLTDYSSTTSFTTPATWSSNPIRDLEVVGTSKDGITIRFEDLRAQVFGDTVDEYRVQYWKSTSDRRYVNTSQMDAATGTVTGVNSGGKVTLTLKKFCNSTATTDSCSAFTAGSTYRFRVSPLKGDVAIADYTDSAGVPAVASAQTLNTPGNVAVDQVTDTQVKLSWNQVPGATTYRLQQKANSTSGTTRYLYDVCEGPKANYPAASYPCTVSGGRVSVTLPKFYDNYTGAESSFGTNKTYYFRVAAQAGDSSTTGSQERLSDYSASYTKAVTPGWPIVPPENIARVASTGTTVTLKWDPPKRWDGTAYTGDVKYRLQVSTKADMTGSMTYPVTGVNQNEYKVTGLKSDTTHYFRVRVVSTDNKTTLSDYVARALTAATTTPTGSAQVTMTPVSGCSADDYRLGAFWGEEMVKNVGPGENGVSSPTFKLTGLRPGGYKLQLQYVGQGNCVSPWVSSNGTVDHESHVLKVSAPTYQVAEANNMVVPQTQQVKAGVATAGTIRGPLNNVLGGVNVTAFGAPIDGTTANPNRGYREVHSLNVTDRTFGTFEVKGLWPNTKYKYYFSLGTTKDDFWCNAVTSSSPGSGLNLTFPGVANGKNCVG